MRRRDVLKTVCSGSAAGVAVLSGCLTRRDSGGYRWKSVGGGEVATVTQELVVSLEPSERVFALDAETGNQRWSYGENTNDLTTYTQPAVDDGVYFGDCGDDDCVGLYALDMDGEQRWESAAIPGRGRPRVADGAVYVANDFGTVQAIDAKTGAKQWLRKIEPGRFGSYQPIVGIGEALYVAIRGLIAFELTDGSTRWQYTLENATERSLHSSIVSDGIGYLVTDQELLAVADGESQWSQGFGERGVGIETEIVGTVSGRLIVLVNRAQSEQFQLQAIDVTTGTREWASGPIEHPNSGNPRVSVEEGAVYLGTDQLRALEATSGEERWQLSIDAGPVQSMAVTEREDEAVVIHSGKTLVGVTNAGEQAWQSSVDGQLRDYIVGKEFIFAATEEAVYAIET